MDEEEIKKQDFDRLVELFGEEKAKNIMGDNYDVYNVRMSIFWEELRLFIKKNPYIAIVIILLIVLFLLLKP